MDGDRTIHMGGTAKPAHGVDSTRLSIKTYQKHTHTRTQDTIGSHSPPSMNLYSSLPAVCGERYKKMTPFFSVV